MAALLLLFISLYSTFCVRPSTVLQIRPRSARQIKSDLNEMLGQLREMRDTRRVVTGASLEGH